ncbi:MAG: hypothetical protein ABI068_11750 [Ktedonobacterales bacterium]
MTRELRSRYAAISQITPWTPCTVYERGWSTLTNGALLTAAEWAGYDLFLTTDKNLRYQQNLTGRRLAILVLGTTSWPKIQQDIGHVQSTIDAMSPGAYQEIAFDASS